MGFTEQLIAGLTRGQSYKRNKRIEDEEVEDRDIEKKILQHRVKEMSIQDQIRARAAVRENLETLHGQPEDSFPWSGERMKSAPSAMGASFGTMEVPDRDIPTVDIPGVDELGIPGVSAKPRTMEQLLADQLYQLRQKALNTPQSASRGERIVLPSTGEVLAEGGDFREPKHRVVERDAAGVETERWLDDEEVEGETFTRQRRPPTAGTGGGGASKLTDEERVEVVNGYRNGLLPADQIPNTTEGLRIKGALAKAGFNVTRAATDIRAFRTHLSTLNSGQQQQVLIAAETAEKNLDALDALIQAERDPAIWTPGSKKTADVQAAAKAVIDAVAIIKSGGSQPNNQAIESAAASLTTGLFSGKIGPKVKRLRDALGIRVASIKGSFVSSEDVTNAPAGIQGGGADAPKRDPGGIR